MRRAHHNTILGMLCAGGSVCTGVIGGATAAQPPHTAPAAPRTAGLKPVAQPAVKQAGPAKTADRYGDMSIVGYTEGGGDFTAGIRYKGNSTVVEVPDKAGHAVLKLHADDIFVHEFKNNTFQTVDLTGHVTYTVVQKTPEGTRIVEGSAAHAVYQRLAHRIEQSGGVHLKLTDDTHLNGPALIRADRVIADIGDTPYRYTLEGAPATTDIRFVPREQAGQANAAAPAGEQIGEVHIHGFRNGDFQAGKTIVFTGPETVAHVTGSGGKGFAQLEAPRIEAAFNDPGTAVDRVTASGEVHYSSDRPAVPGKTVHLAAQGTAASVTFLMPATGRQVVIHGPYANAIDDPRVDGTIHFNGSDSRDLFTIT